MSHAIPVRTVLPETGYGAIDDGRIDLFYLVISNTEALSNSRPELLNEDITAADKFFGNLLSVITLQIQSHASFVSIDQLKQSRENGSCFGNVARLFHHDHLRPEIRQY